MPPTTIRYTSMTVQSIATSRACAKSSSRLKILSTRSKRSMGWVTGSRNSSFSKSPAGGIKMAIGNVKWFNPIKGYGFIQPQGGGQDVFVHISAVERAGLSTLNEGQQVEYEVVSNRGKSSAENLKVK